MGNAPDVESSQNDLPSHSLVLHGQKISYQNIDDVPVEVLEHLLSEEISANQKKKIEAVITE